MKTIATTCFFALALSTMLVALAPSFPASADPTTTTQQITTSDGYSGTRTTTVDGTTTTVVDKISKTEKDGGHSDITSTTTTYGKPIKTKTVKSTKKTYDKAGKPMSTTETSVKDSDFNEAGAFTETYSTVTTSQYPDGTAAGKLITEGKNQCDADGKVVSGSYTESAYDAKGTQTGRDNYDATPSSSSMGSVFPAALTTSAPTQPSEGNKPPSPAAEPAPEQKHHTSVWGWLLGAGALAAILAGSGNHGGTISSAATQPVNPSQLTFTPTSVSVCLNKTATAVVKDPSNPSAQFQVMTVNTGVVQLGSPTTTGPIVITPLGLGTTNIFATEGSSKTGMLPVTVTPAC
jgi:hypothetical protein